jgi:hypothetical protein
VIAAAATANRLPISAIMSETKLRAQAVRNGIGISASFSRIQYVQVKMDDGFLSNPDVTNRSIRSPDDVRVAAASGRFRSPNQSNAVTSITPA